MIWRIFSFFLEEKVEVEEEEEDEQSKDEPTFSVNPDTPVGHDYVRQVVMFYCDLCHKYLPKLNRGDPDELIDTHCVSTSHQDAYVKKQIEEQEALKALAEVIYLFLLYFWPRVQCSLFVVQDIVDDNISKNIFIF